VTVGDAEGQTDASGISYVSSSEVLARGIPGAKFVVIPGQGHYYPFVNPQATHKVVREFLASSLAMPTLGRWRPGAGITSTAEIDI
jgi:hypothetical protein